MSSIFFYDSAIVIPFPTVVKRGLRKGCDFCVLWIKYLCWPCRPPCSVWFCRPGFWQLLETWDVGSVLINSSFPSRRGHWGFVTSAAASPNSSLGHRGWSSTLSSGSLRATTSYFVEGRNSFPAWGTTPSPYPSTPTLPHTSSKDVIHILPEKHYFYHSSPSSFPDHWLHRLLKSRGSVYSGQYDRRGGVRQTFSLCSCRLTASSSSCLFLSIVLLLGSGEKIVCV